MTTMSEKEERQAVRERKILQSESRWLQKALFALSKADDDRGKLGGDLGGALSVTIAGEVHAIDVVTSAMKDAVEKRAESLRSAVSPRPLLGR
jgi:hypothetical protein